MHSHDPPGYESPRFAQLRTEAIDFRLEFSKMSPECRRVIGVACVTEFVAKHIAHECRWQEEKLRIQADRSTIRVASPTCTLAANARSQNLDARLAGKLEKPRHQMCSASIEQPPAKRGTPIVGFVYGSRKNEANPVVAQRNTFRSGCPPLDVPATVDRPEIDTLRPLRCTGNCSSMSVDAGRCPLDPGRLAAEKIWNSSSVESLRDNNQQAVLDGHPEADVSCARALHHTVLGHVTR